MTRILSLDNDSEVLDVIHMLLTESGYEHLFTTDSHVALSILEQQSVDLITQDWSRPDMDGWEFYSHLKAVEGLYDIPLMVITASDRVMSEATIQLLQSRRPDLKVRGFQIAKPNRQPALSTLAGLHGLEIAYVDGYVPKPCTVGELLREVERVLNARKGSLSGEKPPVRPDRRDYDPHMRILGAKMRQK